MVNIEPKQPPKGVSSRKPMSFVRREPRGTKIGGRFADAVSSETTVELGGDEVSGYQPDGSGAFEERMRRSRENAAEHIVADERQPTASPSVDEALSLGGAVEYSEGSWQYPPAARTVDQIVGFFRDCEISDSAIANIEAADRWGRDYFSAKEEFDKWRSENPGWGKRQIRKDPEGFAAAQAESKKRRIVLDAVQYNTGLIPREELRDAARIGGLMLLASDSFDEDARRQVYRTKFRLGTGEVVEAGDLFHRYRLRDIAGAFFNRVRFERFD